MISRICFLVLCVAVLSASASAGMSIEMNTTSGGIPYTATVKEDSIGIYVKGEQFDTFCIEKNEYFNPGGIYDVVLNTNAVNGGNDGGQPDPLDYRTAFLYTQYTNRVTGFVDAVAMQNAIWFIEQELGDATLDSLGNTVKSYVTDAKTAIDGGNWSGIGNVRVMNLTQNGVRKQDQLVIVHPVPVPGAFLLSGLGVACVGWMKRRRSL